MTVNDYVKELEKLSKEELVLILAKDKSDKMTNPGDFAKLANKYLQDINLHDQEHFFIFTLNGNLGVIGFHVISKGLVNRTVVHPREVFRPAIADNAVAIIIGHNHPSGYLKPSQEDIDVNRKLNEAGKLIGIPIMDSVIVSYDGTYYSMLENGSFTQ